ncbi:MAG TPA: hypothetical protein VNS09_18690 [Solirubrobacter sp.]|nr:hypothetical protein [Solirubrobacter sp.]
MKLRTILATSALAALAVPSAALAQSADPVGGGVGVGGSVPSFLELILPQPAKGFASFSKTKSYEMSIAVTAISTDGPTLLSIADGDATKGSKLGYISVGKKKLPSPLEARVGKAAFQPLNASVDPLLTKWTDATGRSNGTATIKLRQKVKGKSTGSYRKVALVTLSTETP